MSDTNNDNEEHQPSNTLIAVFTNFNNQAADKAQELFNTIATPFYFTSLKTFRKCIVAYMSTAQAMDAMERYHGYKISENNTMYLGYTEHTPLTEDEIDYLPVPELEKQWLISPPGSPHVGWVQQREDPPNIHHVDKELNDHIKKRQDGVVSLRFDHSDDDEDVKSNISSPPPLDLDNPNPNNNSEIRLGITGFPQQSKCAESTASLSPSSSSSQRGSATSKPSTSSKPQLPLILIQDMDLIGETDDSKGENKDEALKK
ncbi:hypothetical protein H4219_003954 [Mycoemilia scoparia]|uniref:Calcipressin-like protein n=1 Tax=Mycoemilia scoparia TaxID=417184 RepID=A0A9W8A2N5_9FUNG|nr:hypothetical protein H4219_003954 [Mycoemilia scoparia]